MRRRGEKDRTAAGHGWSVGQERNRARAAMLVYQIVKVCQWGNKPFVCYGIEKAEKG